jgi:intracellular septation protein A
MNFRYFLVWLYTTLFGALSVILAYESISGVWTKIAIIFSLSAMTLLMAYGLSKQEEKEIKHLLGRNGKKEKDYWVKR